MEAELHPAQLQRLQVIGVMEAPAMLGPNLFLCTSAFASHLRNGNTSDISTKLNDSTRERLRDASAMFASNVSETSYPNLSIHNFSVRKAPA